MKRITAIALFLIAAFITADRALAQEPGVQAIVPFDFTVADKLLPSGTYTITRASSGIVIIKNRDNHATAMTTTYRDGNNAKNSKLVFDKYGDQYFLAEILCKSALLNVKVPPSKQEKQARTQEAMVHGASQVLVAAR